MPAGTSNSVPAGVQAADGLKAVIRTGDGDSLEAAEYVLIRKVWLQYIIFLQLYFNK
jgi:hypothetical protein